MDFALRLDQPDIGKPGASRRLTFGAGLPFAILNGLAANFEGHHIVMMRQVFRRQRFDFQGSG